MLTAILEWPEAQAQGTPLGIQIEAIEEGSSAPFWPRPCLEYQLCLGSIRKQRPTEVSTVTLVI